MDTSIPNSIHVTDTCRQSETYILHFSELTILIYVNSLRNIVIVNTSKSSPTIFCYNFAITEDPHYKRT